MKTARYKSQPHKANVGPRGSGRHQTVSPSKGITRRSRPALYSGVLIAPPTDNQREQIKADMKRIRSQMIEDLGQDAYDERLKSSNEKFKSLMAGRGVRV